MLALSLSLSDSSSIAGIKGENLDSGGIPSLQTANFKCTPIYSSTLWESIKMSIRFVFFFLNNIDATRFSIKLYLLALLDFYKFRPLLSKSFFVFLEDIKYFFSSGGPDTPPSPGQHWPKPHVGFRNYHKNKNKNCKMASRDIRSWNIPSCQFHTWSEVQETKSTLVSVDSENVVWHRRVTSSYGSNDIKDMGGDEGGRPFLSSHLLRDKRGGSCGLFWEIKGDVGGQGGTLVALWHLKRAQSKDSLFIKTRLVAPQASRGTD